MQYESIKERPAVQRAYALLSKDCKIGDKSDATHDNLFKKQTEVGNKTKRKADAVPKEDEEEAPADTKKARREAPKAQLW